jgi:hypothetical protein
MRQYGKKVRLINSTEENTHQKIIFWAVLQNYIMELQISEEKLNLQLLEIF